MQIGFILCALAFAFSADAVDLIKARQQLVQEPVPVLDLMASQPQPVVAEQPAAPPTQSHLVSDAMQALQSSQPLAGTPQVAAMQIGTDGNQPAAQALAPPVSAAQVPSQILLGGTQPAVAAQVAIPAAQTAFQTPPAVQLAQAWTPASSVSAPNIAQVTPQPPARNVTKLAFGQITDLGSEFHQLRQDDQAHIKQLGVDIHLRENLEKELHEAEERLEHDNGELAQETTGIVAATPTAEVAVPQNSTGDSPPALVQAQSVKTKAETDPIAIATSRDVKTLTADMSALHARDASEVKALRLNAETRSTLSAQIAKEREELMADSGGLAANLGEIRDLVAPSSGVMADSGSASVTLADSSNPPVSSTYEALVQQEAPAAAAKDTVTSAEGDAAAATTAPEAAAASTWLR
jgi:hypothetical protein